MGRKDAAKFIAIEKRLDNHSKMIKAVNSKQEINNKILVTTLKQIRDLLTQIIEESA